MTRPDLSVDEELSSAFEPCLISIIWPLQIRCLCLFLRTEDGVNGRSADGALTFECWFTILHGDSLRILHLSLCFAFDTVVLIGHGEVASLHLL
jgi:hypothetical protein